MKTFSYAEDTVTLFKFLKHYPPDRIYTDKFDRVIFDYRNFHFVAESDAFRGFSQDKDCEVLLADFKRINLVFQPSADYELMFQAKAIERLWILQTLLYFTDYIVFNSEAEALGDFEVKTKADEIIANLKKNSRAREEIVCHPDSEEAKSVNREYANLIDAGIMLEIDSQLLMCFSWCNSFGVVGDTMSIDEIKEDVAPFYKLIKI